MRPTVAQQARDMADELRDMTAPEYIDGRPVCSAGDSKILFAADMLEAMATYIDEVDFILNKP